jgi:hypothetical protein
MTEIAIDEAIAHLGAALVQTVPSDDQIIIGHVRSAYTALIIARRAYHAKAVEKPEAA